MASGSQAPDDVPTGRSGGKILKERRAAARKTPYDRPIPHQPQSPLPPPESPSWLSGLVSPAKFVAGGASKVLSSFWNPKSWGKHSSSSSESDYESEDVSGDDENPSDRVIELNQQQKGGSSQKIETLHLIEQLLMLEQYSREEGDRLIEIINSRVVDNSMKGVMEAGPSMIRSSTNNETPDIGKQAIMEAKKWVAENKSISGLRSDLDNGNYAHQSVVTLQATEVEAGSPIDVAKSYMKARPPWASPISYDNAPTPSPLAADLLKERTPYSSGGGISFSSAKRDYLSAGSWNIQDEIRRVRSKATEDLLNSHRSVKFALSTLEHDTAKHSLPSEKSITVVGRDEPINLETTKSADEIANLVTQGSNPALSDTRTAQNDLPTAMPVLEQYQGIHSEKKQSTRPSGEGNGPEKDEDSGQPDERNLDQENDDMSNDTNDADKNCFLMTESPDIPLINSSQDTPNANDHSVAAKPVGVTTRGASRSTRKRERKR